MADIADILRELAYARAGGGRKTGPQQFAEMLAQTGAGLGAAGTGIEKGLEAKKTALEGQKLYKEVTEPEVPVELPLSPTEQAQANSNYENLIRQKKAEQVSSYQSLLNARDASQKLAQDAYDRRMRDLQPMFQQRNQDREKFLSRFSPTYPLPQGQTRLRQDIPESDLAQAGLGQIQVPEPPAQLPTPQVPEVQMPERPSMSRTVSMNPKNYDLYSQAKLREAQIKALAGQIPVDPLTGEIHNVYQQGDRFMPPNEAYKFGRARIGAEGADNRQQRTFGQQEKMYDMTKEERINKAVLDYSDKLDNSYVLRELRRQEIGLNSADDLINLARSGNTVGASAVGMKVARGLGEVGVLTETDVTRYVQSGQLDRKAADILSRWINGKPTDATLDEILQITNSVKQTFANKIQPIYDQAVNRLSRNMKITPEEAAYRLDVPYSGGIGGGKIKSLESRGSIDFYMNNPNVSDVDKRKAELAKQAGKNDKDILAAFETKYGNK